jgi:hypothetical protein
MSVDLGFNRQNVLTLEVEPLDQTATIRREYYAAMADALRELPEVVAAGALDQRALNGGGTYGFPKADTGAAIEGPQRTVLPGYFQAISVRAVQGRLLEDADRVTGEAALINVTGAQKYFGGNAVDHTMQTKCKFPRQWRIVGVVPNLRHGGPPSPCGTRDVCIA